MQSGIMGSWSLDVASDKHYARGQVCLPPLFRGLEIGIPSLQADHDYLVNGMFTNKHPCLYITDKAYQEYYFLYPYSLICILPNNVNIVLFGLFY